MSGGPRDSGPFWYRFGRYPYLLAKLALALALVAGLLWVMRSLESVLFPVFVSVLIAYLLDPYVDRLEARGHSRNTAIALIAAALGVVAIGFVAFLYPLLLSQFVQLTERVPAAIQGIDERLLPWVAENTPLELPPTLSETLREYAQDIENAAPEVLKRVGSWGAGMIARTSSVVVGLLNAVMIPIFAYYFLRDFDRAKWGAAEWIPPRFRGAALSRLSAMDDVVGAWFRGQVQVSIILAVLYAIGLALVFALTDHSIFDGVAVGVISGLLNVIPYFGFAVGILLALLVVIVEWNGLWGLIGVGIVFAVVQGLEGYVITPRIVGEKVGLSPVIVILVLLIGGEVAGLLGVLLALPVAGALKVVLPDLGRWYRSTEFYAGASVAALSASRSTLQGAPLEAHESGPAPASLGPEPRPGTRGAVEGEGGAPLEARLPERGESE